MSYDLDRFKIKQQREYEIALSEIKRGCKETHWMWYIFPQLVGLGRSSTSETYGIKNLQEAMAYMQDPVLKEHLLTISGELLQLTTNNVREVFNAPDDKKLKFCMTLFAIATPENKVFQKVLDKFFGGQKDKKTLRLLEKNMQIDKLK